MLLKNVEINNFKSIESCEMDIEKGCKVFVGLSESGKSNLLCALSCLDPGFNLTKEYIKEGTDDRIFAIAEVIKNHLLASI